MSLQFVLGGSGSGKSTYVFDKIIERSMKEENKNFFILVPDQFTMQTQMELVNRHPRGGILNIDVLSFSRLSHRILEETGGNRKTVLDDTGKSLVLRKVAEEWKEEIPVLGGNLKKQGYIHEVKSAISEFMQYGIGTKELGEMLKFVEKRGGLYGKLKDLGVLYQGFQKYIQDKFITTEETYERLAAHMEKSDLVKKSVVVLDGFTGFTPVQNSVIEKLLLLAEEVIITITIDKKETKKQETSEQELFSLSKKTISSMEKIAQGAKATIKEPIWMEETAKRFVYDSGLAHLEKNLFRYPYVQKKGDCDGICILEAPNIEEEIKQACNGIRNLLQEGYCYRDLAVIVGDMSSYGSKIEEIFEEYEIPVFMDQSRKITLNPFVEYIRSAIQIQVKQFSYESMFHYLRSGMVDLDREIIDKLENYCLAHGIKGKRAWSTMFCSLRSDGKNMTSIGSEEKERMQKELEELNNARDKIISGLSVLKSGKQKVKKQTEQLYEFLTANQCQKRLKDYETSFKLAGDKAKEKEYAQIYRLTMDLLDQIVGLLGEEEMTWEEFGQILDAGFGEIQVGIIPQSVDQVVVGDMERTRLKQVKALFFLGINDGNIPKKSGSGGIISDIDREFLAEGEFELAPTPRQQIFIQKFYLYLNVTKPSHKLYLSYAKMNSEGKSLKPSYFISSIEKLFPDLKIQKTEEHTWQQIRTSEDGREYGIQLLEQYKQGNLKDEEEQVLMALLKVLNEFPKGNSWVEDLLDSTFFTYQDTKISPQAAKILYGAIIQSSVSRLEKMASCAYAHFLQYGLGLKERETYSFEAVDMGNIFHGVLDEFARRLEDSEYTWFNFPREFGESQVAEAMEQIAAEYGAGILYSSARQAYGINRMQRILNRTVDTLQKQLQKGEFVPMGHEISFRYVEDLAAVDVTLSQEEKMRLTGRIDRVDVAEEEEKVYVKVIDYKSGTHQFQLASVYYGLQLQLVVYMNAAMELVSKKYQDKDIVPAALLYYHVEDPMVEAGGAAGEEDINQLIQKQLRMSGVVNTENHVVELLDREMTDKSLVIPVEKKKDGSFSAYSSVMTGEEMALVSDYVNHKVREIGREILAGHKQINPYETGKKDACEYCAYKKVCGFDSSLPGYEKRLLEENEKVVIYEKMKEVLE